MAIRMWPRLGVPLTSRWLASTPTGRWSRVGGPTTLSLHAVHPEQLLPTPLPATYGQLVDAVSMRLVYDVLPNAPRAAMRFFGSQPARP